MKHVLDLDTWARKDHFHFFRKFEEPFFGVCVNIDCTRAYHTCKANGNGFFLHYLYCSLVAANETEPFRYRIDGDSVIVHDQVHASPTINRPNGSFGFAYMDYYEDVVVFREKAKQEIDRVQNSTGLVPSVAGQNVIHYSSIPWINFTALSHARSFSFPDSCPKISFGKMTGEPNALNMPVAVHVHHALMDGYHVGKFLEKFQSLMNE